MATNTKWTCRLNQKWFTYTVCHVIYVYINTCSIYRNNGKFVNNVMTVWHWNKIIKKSLTFNLLYVHVDFISERIFSIISMCDRTQTAIVLIALTSSM